jgi:parallel beta-helix repeat protein
MGKSILLIPALLLVGAAPAMAETRRVPADYATIQQAINDCNDGDEVIVEPGTYYEIINFSGKNIVVTSTDPNDPAIVASTIIDADSEGSAVTFENGESADAVLTGFTITGGFGTADTSIPEAGYLFWGAGVYCLNASPTITRNVIVNNNGPLRIEADQPLALSYGGGIATVTSNPTITHNVIKNNSAYAGAGIIVYLGDAQIRNNLIYDNSACVGGGVVLLYGGRLINNTIVGNDSSKTIDGQTGLAGNVYAASEPELGPCLVVNNIICNAKSGGGIYSVDTGQGLFAFNDVWNNSPGNYALQNPETGELTWDGPADKTGKDGNICEDPLFVNPQGKDYHLQLDSPCISAGDPAFIASPGETDIDGEARVFAWRVDMGADEYIGYVKPVADAGPDQHLEKPQLITLDGSGSLFYDPCGVMEFQWDQAAGPAVEFSDFGAMRATFTPECEAEYRFELVVSDGLNFSKPDEVLIVVRNRPPVADAGPDQTMSSIPSIITLNGSGSYDPGGEALTYDWRQIAGPTVELSHENAIQPAFVPCDLGIYVFELVVNDGQVDSEPDVVGIVIGNRAPAADAGLPRYAAQDPVVLDGTGSFDRDGYGELTYQWRQVSGPSVDITDEDTAMPTISGFMQTSQIQRCKFELTVSDGDLASEPDTVEVIIVPSFGNNYFVQVNPPFDPDKPTIVAFGGGDCIMGSGMAFSDPADWYAKVNFLTVSSYGPPYYQYGDALIVYLSSVAPDYAQLIQTIGFSAGNMPAIDVAICVNQTYADARFAVNRVTLLDAACRDFAGDIAKFLASSVDGEPCWIDNYFATLGRYYPGTLNIGFPAPPATDSTPMDWYQQSPSPSYWPGGYIYNDGVTAGYYLSVAGSGKNLRLAPDPNSYYFEWDSLTNYLRFYDESQYPGRIPEAVALVGPEDGAVVDASGAVLSCEGPDWIGAAGYQLLFGADPYLMNYLVSDTPSPPENIIGTFPFETTYWTIRVRDQYGSTNYADPIRIEAANVTAQEISNLNSGKRYGCIQDAIIEAAAGDEIVVSPGIYQYLENINFKGKALRLRSADPADPTVVAATVINGSGTGPVATFSSGEGADTVLAGFTITGGTKGIYCSGASPTITKCTIAGNSGAGIKLWQSSNPTLASCTIAANRGAGIEMWAEKGGRFVKYNYATITNCTIVGNLQHGIFGGKPTVSNSIIYHNGSACNNVQIEGDFVTVAYSDIQGGWPGEGNIDADPLFADPNNGDYHLKSQAGRWDPASESWIKDDVTSLCIDAGDPSSDWASELWPHGKRINMGAFGGTAQASMSQSNLGNVADLNNDDTVHWQDFAQFTDSWRREQTLLAEDLDRNGIVDFRDVAILADSWLWPQ